MAEQGLEQYDRFRIQQLVKPVVNLYRISPQPGGEATALPPVLFARQKRMAFREDIRFFTDETEAEEVFRIKARSVIDVGGRYDVHDAAGQTIGVLEHQFRNAGLRRSTLPPMVRS